MKKPYAVLSSWKIRRATEADIPALLDLRIAMFESMGYSDPLELQKLRQDNLPYMQQALPTGEFMAWVAEAGNEVIASGGAVVHVSPPTVKNPSGREGYILNIYTKPAWRRKGIARAIMETILNEFRSCGFTTVSLRATPDGQPLYEQLGFEVINQMRLQLSKK